MTSKTRPERVKAERSAFTFSGLIFWVRKWTQNWARSLVGGQPAQQSCAIGLGEVSREPVAPSRGDGRIGGLMWYQSQGRTVRSGIPLGDSSVGEHSLFECICRTGI